MELAALDMDCREFSVGNLFARRPLGRIQYRMNPQSAAGRCRRNETDDRFVTDQRFATPVPGDERKESMLDLVPFACSRRKAADADRHFLGARIDRAPHAAPPAAKRGCSQFDRVMIGSNANPTGVFADVADSVWRNAPERLDFEVVDTDLFGLSSRTPFLAGILEIANKFFLFLTLTIFCKRGNAGRAMPNRLGTAPSAIRPTSDPASDCA